MKRQIRRSVFETNSSSTHSLTMCTEEQFNDWKSGKLLFDRWADKFVKPLELTEQDKENAKEEYECNKEMFWKDWDALSDEEKEKWYTKYAREHNLDKHGHYETYDEWNHDLSLEHFTSTYTTPGGEKIIAFGKYGYDA